MTTQAIRTLGVGRSDTVHPSGSTPATAHPRAVELHGSQVVPSVRAPLAADDVPATEREVRA